MAIHKDRSGLTVEIVVGGKELEECEDEESVTGPNTIKTYVEAISQSGAVSTSLFQTTGIVAEKHIIFKKTKQSTVGDSWGA